MIIRGGLFLDTKTLEKVEKSDGGKPPRGFARLHLVRPRTELKSESEQFPELSFMSETDDAPTTYGPLGKRGAIRMTKRPEEILCRLLFEADFLIMVLTFEANEG